MTALDHPVITTDPETANASPGGHYRPQRLVALSVVAAWFIGWPTLFVLSGEGGLPILARPFAGLYVAIVLGVLVIALVEFVRQIILPILFVVIGGFLLWALDREPDQRAD